MNKLKAFFSWIISSKVRIVVAFIFLLLIGFGITRIFAQKTTTPQYQTAIVEKGTIVSTVSASGTVQVANITTISTSATGVVTAVYVKDGDTVSAGQKIADITLDSAGLAKNASAYASYLSAKNALDSANANLYSLQSTMLSAWDTYKTLAEGDLYENADGSPKNDQRALPEFHIAKDDWLVAEAKYKNQQGVINQAQAAVSSSWYSYSSSSPYVTALSGGIITNVTIASGMTLSNSSDTAASNRIAVIQYSGNPILSFNVSELDIPKIKPDQKATITVDSLGDKTFTGHVLTVDRIGNVSSNVTNYPVTIELDTDSLEMLPNMAASVNIIIDTKTDVLFVPAAAILNQNGISIVRVLKNGISSEVQVETGLKSDTQIEIISGIWQGDTVITGTSANVANQTSGTSIFAPRGFGGGAGGAVRIQR